MDYFSNIDYLQRSLSLSSTRQSLISNNIANVDTPSYKTMDVSFDEILSTEKEKRVKDFNFQGNQTNEKHYSIGKSNDCDFEPKIIVQNNSMMLNNGNNVDIDLEMTKLAENEIWYNTLTGLLSKEFSILRYVITEGNG